LSGRGARTELEDDEPGCAAAEDLVALLAVDVGRLDRVVVLRQRPVGGGRIRVRRRERRRIREFAQDRRQVVGVDLRPPLAERLVEHVDGHPARGAGEQLVGAVAVDVGELDRLVLLGVRPAAGITPARQHEHRPARPRIRR
jgi:hypothetical protein